MRHLMLVLPLLLFLLAGISSSVGEDVAEERCSLPASAGDCRARKLRVFFNADTGRCELFFYTGCGGNGNNFRTLRDCHDKCAARHRSAGAGDTLEAHVKSPHCAMPPVQGMVTCRAAFPKFTFNVRTGTCDRYLCNNDHCVRIRQVLDRLTLLQQLIIQSIMT